MQYKLKVLLKAVMTISIIIVFIIVQPLIIYAFDNQQQFYEYLINEGIDIESEKGRPANFEIYKKYNLIVYGSPFGDTKPTSTDPQRYPGTQYRYLGYTVNDEPYTNPYFPPDAIGNNKPENWNYIPVYKAIQSWDMLDDIRHDYMLQAPLSGNGATSPTFTVMSIGGKEYAKLLSPSTWQSEGSVYTQHQNYPGGPIWYATFTTPPMVGDILATGEVTTAKDTYIITRDADSVTIQVKVTANAVLTGYARADQVKHIEAGFNGSKNSGSKVGSVTLVTDYVLSRNDYEPGTYQVRLDGQVMVESKYGDYDTANPYKVITLIVEPKGAAPYVQVRPNLSPSTLHYKGGNIPVKLTVRGILNNYSNLSNISKWDIWGGIEGEAPILRTVNEHNTTVTQDFNFTLPASVMSGVDNYTQGFTAKVRVYFIEPVMGQEYLEAESIVHLYIYKDTGRSDPSTPGNMAPVARITVSSDTVRAGDYLSVSGEESTDPDGNIVKYVWSMPKAVDKLTNQVAGAVWYPVSAIGGNVITLTVEDDKGAADTAKKSITVTPPYPEARFDIVGTLKENRKFTLVNTSVSPGRYPLDPDQTIFTITPLSGGTQSDIKYSGSLKGIDRKDILIKKAGTYKVTLNVTNTAGYSDTIEKVITIAPDMEPVAEYSIIPRVYRDPADGMYARIDIEDMSYSPDKDYIASKVWTITYNADNNKNPDGTSDFSNDASITIDSNAIPIGQEITKTLGGITLKFIKVTDKTLRMKTTHIGYYLIELEVTEEFGQETIEQYITAADRKKGNSTSKHYVEKVVMVDNRPPVVDFKP